MQMELQVVENRLKGMGFLMSNVTVFNNFVTTQTVIIIQWQFKS